MQWETVIGLEVHTQLTTPSNIVSGASIAFGAAPTTQACQVDIALPGVLPVLNKGAVERDLSVSVIVLGGWVMQVGVPHAASRIDYSITFGTR